MLSRRTAYASLPTEAMSFTAASRMPEPGEALTIRAMLRPIRPNPLMPSEMLTQTPQADPETTLRPADGRETINQPSLNRHYECATCTSTEAVSDNVTPAAG